jgi:hypothetical protein
MAPGEAAQERPERRRCQHDVAEHRLRVARPQGIGVVDRVATGQGRVDKGHGLVPYMGPPRSIAEVDVLVEQLQQTQVLGQRGRQHEPGVGHQMIVVEGHLTAVQAVAKSHRESAFLVWVWAASATTIFPFQKGVFADTRLHNLMKFGGSGLSLTFVN